jgi:hypothetical protein
MNYKMVKTKGQEKARKSFDYQCRLASKCRHERLEYCASCTDKDTCAIQKAIEAARAKM